jgi:hypothetical protein
MMPMLASLMVKFFLLLGFANAQAIASSANYEILDTPQGPEKNYFVFLNLNTSRVEQVHYRAVAQELGYGFLMIPDSKTVNRMAVSYEKFIDDHCESQAQSMTRNCKKLDDDLVAAADQYGVDLDRDLPAALNSIHQGKIRALVISGHHSDEGMSGDYLSINTYKHTQIIQQILKQKALDRGLFSKIEFFGLWGCDSVSERTVEPYRTALPSLRLIAGYGDIAPSGIREESGRYLGSLLRNQLELIAMGSKEELRRAIARIESVHQIFAAVWVRTLNAGSFLYRHSSHVPERVVRYEDDCNDFLAHRYRYEKQLVREYYSGELSIPHDDAQSNLRAVYYDFTSYSACYLHGELNSKNEMIFLSPARIGMLRFFVGVKENFIALFHSRYDSLIYKSDRKGLIQLVSQLKWGTHEDLRMSLLIERYLIQLDERCIDFLSWHAKRSVLPIAHCALNSADQWIDQ